MRTETSKQSATERAQVATETAALGQQVTGGAFVGAMVAQAFAGMVFSGAYRPDDLALSMASSVKRVQAGDHAELQEMLMGQAKACQAIFLALSMQAAQAINAKSPTQAGDSDSSPTLTPAELIRLALQAQQQSADAVWGLMVRA